MLALPALAVNSPLTDEKWAFVRVTPCPATGYKTIACTGYVIGHPACEPTRDWMRWVKTADKPVWDAKGKVFCTCRATPAKVFDCTTRGCRLVAVNCRL